MAVAVRGLPVGWRREALAEAEGAMAAEVAFEVRPRAPRAGMRGGVATATATARVERRRRVRHCLMCHLHQC